MLESVFNIKAWKPATLFKKDSNACIFLSILRNIWKQHFYRTSSDDCFWMLPFVKKMKQKIVANEASKTVESNSKKQKENPILRSCFHALFHPLTLFLEALWVSVWIWRRGRVDELFPWYRWWVNYALSQNIQIIYCPVFQVFSTICCKIAVFNQNEQFSKDKKLK